MEIGKSLKLLNEIEASPLFRFRDALTELKTELNSISEGLSARDQALKEKAALEQSIAGLKAEEKTVKEDLGKLQKAHKQKVDQLDAAFEKEKSDQEKDLETLRADIEAKKLGVLIQAQKETDAKVKEVETLDERIKEGREVLREMAANKATLEREINQLQAGLDQLRQQHFGG